MACENVTKIPIWLNRAPEVLGNGTQASITQPLNAPSKRGDCNLMLVLSPTFVAYDKKWKIMEITEPTVHGWNDTFLNAVTRARKQNSKQGPVLVRWFALVFNTFINESDKLISMFVPWQ